jgi:hypothetical protein
MKKKIAFAMMMGVVTTGIISLTLISFNVGFKPNFIAIWLRSWVLAYVIAIPCILIIAPKIEQMVEYMFRETNNTKLK